MTSKNKLGKRVKGRGPEIQKPIIHPPIPFFKKIPFIEKFFKNVVNAFCVDLPLDCIYQPLFQHQHILFVTVLSNTMC